MEFSFTDDDILIIRVSPEEKKDFLDVVEGVGSKWKWEDTPLSPTGALRRTQMRRILRTALKEEMS